MTDWDDYRATARERAAAQWRAERQAREDKLNVVSLPGATTSRAWKKMATVQQWADEMGVSLSHSFKTKLSMRANRMYRATFGKAPRQVNVTPKDHKGKKRGRAMANLYPRLVIERAWQVEMTVSLRNAETVDDAAK